MIFDCEEDKYGKIRKGERKPDLKENRKLTFEYGERATYPESSLQIEDITKFKTV